MTMRDGGTHSLHSIHALTGDPAAVPFFTRQQEADR